MKTKLRKLDWVSIIAIILLLQVSITPLISFSGWSLNVPAVAYIILFLLASVSLIIGIVLNLERNYFLQLGFVLLTASFIMKSMIGELTTPDSLYAMPVGFFRPVIAALSCILLALFSFDKYIHKLPDALSTFRNKFSKLWFLPSLLIAIADPGCGVAILIVTAIVIFGDDAKNQILNLRFLFGTKNQGSESSIPVNKRYISIPKFLFLSIITIGIYHFVWVYEMTKLTNSVSDEPYRSPAKKMLLTLFIPAMYPLFWRYKTATRLCKMESAAGRQSNAGFVVVATLMPIPLLGSILLQDKVNEIALASASAPKTKENKPSMASITETAEPAKTEVNTKTVESIPEDLKATVEEYQEMLKNGDISEAEYDAMASVTETAEPAKTEVNTKAVESIPEDLKVTVEEYQEMLKNGDISEEEYDATVKVILDENK